MSKIKLTHTKPNVILASFPRSGNTFLRNILIDVLGVYSWNNIEVYNDAQKKLFKYESKKMFRSFLTQKVKNMEKLKHKLSYHVIKSHEIPSKILHLCDDDVKIIYLIRDGRDALVSMAHHRKDIIEPGTDFIDNLSKSIKAPRGSYFGGWGQNVTSWTKIANLVIHFENLVNNPVKEILRIREFLDLPEPNLNNIPTFESQRSGGSHFGGKNRKNLSKEKQDEFNSMFFRKGKIGSWKEDMPEKIHEIFWKKYGKKMLEMGYQKDGTFKPQ